MTRRALQHAATWAVVLCLPLSALAAGVAETTPVLRPARDGYTAEVLAHAFPDEYFYGVGNVNNTYVPTGIADPYNMPEASTAKVNQAYVWGLGKVGNDIYFGTLANGNLLVQAVYLTIDDGSTNSGGGSYGYYNPEASEGADAFWNGSAHPDTQDWRPPQLFHYNLASRSIELLDPNLPQQTQDHLQTLAGIRAGGAATTNAYNNHQMVLLAGPPLDHATGGVGFFLFDATTGEFKGSTINYNYNNIRRMACVNGDLYFGVQKTNTLDGAVVRWVNNPKAAGWPFIFQEVGTLDEMGADICVHEGRLFCTTWPGYVEGSLADILVMLEDPAKVADIFKRSPGLFMSPVVPAGGLTPAHRTQWQKVWSIANYEPDQVIALTLGGGALASFDGYLYFGTMQVPSTGSLAFQFMYGAPVRPTRPVAGSPTEDFVAFTNARAAYNLAARPINTNTVRAVSIFRGRNFRTPTIYQGQILKLGGDFEVLYGSEKMPVFNPAGTNDNYNATNWVWTANKMTGKPAIMGEAGFGDRQNVYTWTMEVFKNTLFVGTYDGSLPYGARSVFEVASTNTTSTFGSDLYRLHSSQASHFQAVSLNGLGNICNYGFRTMASDAAGLYIGTANPRNLRCNPTNTTSYGGWELLKLTRRATTAFDMDGDFDADAAWMIPGSMVAVRSSTASTTNYPATTTALAAWADYDRDGIADPAWCDPAKGTWTVWLSSRDGQKTTLPVFAYSASVPVPADFDGDGKADPALCAVAGGKISWRSSKDGKTYSVAPGVALAFPACGDYNGDGVAELAWYVRPAGATPGRIIRSSSTTLAKLTSQNLTGAFAKGIPVPADYDGDGKTDFALHDPLTGVIRVWRSSDGVVVDSLAAGAGWIPMPFDYDGDGKTDFAWFYPSSASLRVQNSSTGVDEGVSDMNALFGIPTSGARPVNAPAAVWYTK